jgi:hypothetical protein
MLFVRNSCAHFPGLESGHSWFRSIYRYIRAHLRKNIEMKFMPVMTLQGA